MKYLFNFLANIWDKDGLYWAKIKYEVSSEINGEVEKPFKKQLLSVLYLLRVIYN